MAVYANNPLGMCQRTTVCNRKPAKWLLRRTCDKCDYFQVLEICDDCKEYIERRNNFAREMPLDQRPRWRCMGCHKNRRMPVGMDILGRA
jgi:hypothetical protein